MGRLQGRLNEGTTIEAIREEFENELDAIMIEEYGLSNVEPEMELDREITDLNPGPESSTLAATQSPVSELPNWTWYTPKSAPEPETRSKGFSTKKTNESKAKGRSDAFRTLALFKSDEAHDTNVW